MKKRNWIRLALLSLPIAAAGCGGTSTGNGLISVRAFDATPGQASINIAVGANIVMSGGTYGTGTGYQSIAQTGSQLFLMTSNTGATLSDPTYNLQSNTSYTLYGTGPVASPSLILISEDHSSPGANARVNLVNLSSVTGNTDVYLTAPGATLTGATPTVTGLAFQSNFAALVAPGSYEVRFCTVGTKTVVADQTVGALVAGQLVRYLMIDSSTGTAPETIVSLADGS